MKQLSAYHIGKNWLDSDAFCELQPIIGLTSQYDKFDEWENVEHRNLILAKPAKPTLGGLILANCEAWNEDLVRVGRSDRWRKDIENHVQRHGVNERARTSHCTYSFVWYCECEIGRRCRSRRV